MFRDHSIALRSMAFTIAVWDPPTAETEPGDSNQDHQETEYRGQFAIASPENQHFTPKHLLLHIEDIESQNILAWPT